jgi:hypothetical protein
MYTHHHLPLPSINMEYPMDLIDLLIIIMYIVAGIVGWVYVATSRK